MREVIDKSRPVADVARGLGLVPQTLTNWVASRRRANAESGEEVPLAAKCELFRREERDLDCAISTRKMCRLIGGN
ncbi:transposase [Rathayibacter iranicus NCPPB 2253 = VKM Ac-1602]|nr:transposase [Rathayibacter iranicus NCPPB 2253 = VKM Ac-1602]